MTDKKEITAVGGDIRQVYAAEYLAAHGFSVKSFGLERAALPADIKVCSGLSEAAESEYILFPLPAASGCGELNAPLSEAKISLAEAAAAVKKRHTVFFGKATEEFARQISQRAARAFDYFDYEPLVLNNALLTAEGIAGLLIDTLPVSVYNLHTGITGCGRVGFLTAQRLSALGADVTVFARNAVQRTFAEINGIKACEIEKLEALAKSFDCIINTVPAKLIDESIIAASAQGCVFIETAGPPYGIDFQCAEKYGRKLVKAFGLPGKTAPKTAGELIGRTLTDILKEVEKLG